MRWLSEHAGRVLPLVASTALVLVCAGRLVVRPGALIVDPERPSIDDTQRSRSRTLGNDLTRLFLPHQTRISAHWARHGRLPMWDPSGFGGRPSVGNPQAGLFYPPVWLAWWSGAPSALGWLTVGHLLWAGFGTYTLSRTLKLGRLAASIASVCFSASPYVLAQTFEGHYPHVWAASWYPWAFAASCRMRRGDAWGILALPPILALTFLAGHPQECYYLALVLGVWAVADAVRSGRDRPAVGRLIRWGAVLVLTLGLIAVEFVVQYDAQAWALRSGRLSLKHASRYHVNPLNLLQLLSPAALGGPADYLGHDNYWETVLSIGWVPLVLVVLALARSPRRGQVRGWAILAASAIAFAAGRRLGLFALLYATVPGMDLFRAPARALFLAALAASVLAGFGLEALGVADDWGGWQRRQRRAVGLILLGIAVSQGLIWRFHVGEELGSMIVGVQESGPEQIPNAAIARKPQLNRDRELIRWVLAGGRLARDVPFLTALVGTTIAFAWLRRRPDDRRVVALALAALTMAELGAHGHSLVKVAQAGRFLGPDPIAEAVARVRPRGPIRIRARDAFYNDLRAFRNGLEKTNANDSFQIQHAADLYETLYPLFTAEPHDGPERPMDRAVADFRREVRQGVLDRMNVALLITDEAEPDVSWPIVASGRWGSFPFTIYGNPTALPRAYVVPRACRVPDGDSPVLHFRNVPARAAVVMRDDPLGPGPRQPYTPAEYDATDPDRVRIRVETEAPGLLVVADTWMPGWTARVDGRPAPILRGNHAQRVIPLPRPGQHNILMTYQPPKLALGLGITAASGCLWFAAILIVALRRHGRRPGRPAHRTLGPIRAPLLTVPRLGQGVEYPPAPSVNPCGPRAPGAGVPGG